MAIFSKIAIGGILIWQMAIQQVIILAITQQWVGSCIRGFNIYGDILMPSLLERYLHTCERESGNLNDVYIATYAGSGDFSSF